MPTPRWSMGTASWSSTRPTWVNIAAALVVRVTMSALCLAHVERTRSLPGENNSRMVTWVISHGKGVDRADYKVSSPRFVAKNLDFERLLEKELKGHPHIGIGCPTL